MVFTVSGTLLVTPLMAAQQKEVPQPRANMSDVHFLLWTQYVE